MNTNAPGSVPLGLEVRRIHRLEFQRHREPRSSTPRDAEWPQDRSELAQRQVARIGVFGSMARGEATAQSDIDVLVGLDLPTNHQPPFDCSPTPSSNNRKYGSNRNRLLRACAPFASVRSTRFAVSAAYVRPQDRRSQEEREHLEQEPPHTAMCGPRRTRSGCWSGWHCRLRVPSCQQTVRDCRP